MAYLATKPNTTIEQLIQISESTDIVWDYKSDTQSEYLLGQFKITDEKTIDIKITNWRMGVNYWIEFFYNGSEITKYWYQNYRKIFELFVYAKFVNFIVTTGEKDFVDIMIMTWDNFEWVNIGDSFYSALLEKHNKVEARLNVWNGGIEVELDGDLIYNMRDKKLFTHLNNNI